MRRQTVRIVRYARRRRIFFSHEGRQTSTPLITLDHNSSRVPARIVEHRDENSGRTKSRRPTSVQLCCEHGAGVGRKVPRVVVYRGSQRAS
eukprot:4173883-Prymnesium_polylepis.1